MVKEALLSAKLISIKQHRSSALLHKTHLRKPFYNAALCQYGQHWRLLRQRPGKCNAAAGFPCKTMCCAASH